MSNQLSLTDPLTFGKYRGTPLKEVIKEDITYIEWAVDTVMRFDLDDEAWEKYEAAIDEHYGEQAE